MSLKAVIVSLNFLFISITAFGQYTYIQKLGSIATVALPDTPKLVAENGHNQYLLNYKGVIFFVTSGPVNKGISNIFKTSGTDSAYNDYIKGFLGTVKGSLLYRDKIKVNGHEAIQFAYKSLIKKQQFYGSYRLILLGDTLVTCGVMSSDLVSKDDKNLKLFFNNFKVISAAELDEIDASNAAHKFGSIIGTLIAFSLPVAIGLAIVFLLKKMIYKKRKQQSP